jgi:hypothetical protein
MDRRIRLHFAKTNLKVDGLPRAAGAPIILRTGKAS